MNHDKTLVSPDTFLASAQKHLSEAYSIANPGVGGLRAPEFYAAFDTLAHARYLIAENKPEDWPRYFGQMKNLPQSIRHLRIKDGE